MAQQASALPGPPMGFLRSRSGSFDAGLAADGAPIPLLEPEVAELQPQAGAAVCSKDDDPVEAAQSGHKWCGRLPDVQGVITQQPPEVEEGNVEYKFVLKPSSAGECLHLRQEASCLLAQRLLLPFTGLGHEIMVVSTPFVY